MKIWTLVKSSQDFWMSSKILVGIMGEMLKLKLIEVVLFFRILRNLSLGVVYNKNLNI